MDEGPIKFASGGDDIKIWDLSSSTPQQQFSPHAGPISALCWSQNNQLLASASSVGDKIVLSYGKSLTTNIIELAVGDKQTCLSMNSTSRYLVCGGKNKLVSIWDLKNKKLKRTYKEHRDSISCVVFNWNDSYLASGSVSGEILLHNVVSGQAAAPMIASNGQTIRDVGYSFFKKSLLAAASDDGSLTLWDSNTGKRVTSFTDAHNAPATSLSFSPLNNLLLASSGLDKRVVCYDVNGRSVIKTMTVESPLTSLSFMQDGATLAAGSIRGKIYVFDLRMGSSPLKTLNAHKSSVQAIRFQNANATPKPNGPVSKPRTSSSQKKSSSSTSIPTSHEASSSSSIPDNVKASKESLNEKTNGDPSPRYEMDNMDIISPIRERGDSTTVRTLVKNGPNSVTDDRPETMGKAETQQRHNSLPDAGIFSPLSSEVDKPSVDSSVRRNPIGSVAMELSPFGPIRRAFPNNMDGLDNGTSTATSNSVRFRSPLHSPVDLPSPRRTSFPTTVMDTRCIPASLNIHPVGLDGDTRMEGEEEDVVSPVTTPTIHRPVFSPEEPPLTSFPRSYPSPAPTYSSEEVDPRMKERAVGGGGGREGGAAGSSLQNTPFQEFQVEFIKNLIEESLDQFRVAIHRDVTNLQLEMLRQFQIQQTEIQSLLERYSVNEGLLSEIETLREENKRLKNKY